VEPVLLVAAQISVYAFTGLVQSDHAFVKLWEEGWF
jgi:hypothetical protein